MRRLVRGIAALGLALAMSRASAQTLVLSGAGVSTGPGGGARTVVFDSGRYYVFVHDGASVVYVTTIDGVSFSAPIPASSGAGAAARLGFAVAKGGSGLGLVWGDLSGTTGSLWYREAVLGPTLTFGPITQIDQGPDLGYQPVLTYASDGTPFIASVKKGAPPGGCGGPSNQYRGAYYAFDGASWRSELYCSNWINQLTSFTGWAVARSGNNVIPAWVVTGTLSTSVLGPTARLGDIWTVVSDATVTSTMQLSSVQSAATATDVHHVYSDKNGGVSYARQDGTNVAAAAPGLDLTSVAAVASSPVIARPSAGSGCYTIAYASGMAIRRTSFANAIASLAAPTTAFTTTAAPTNLTMEESATVAPAITWTEGTSLYFGVPSGGPAPTATAVPTSAWADGSSNVSISAGPFNDACGNPIPNGTLVTVTTSAGTVVATDSDGALSGVQVPSAAGVVSFTLQAPAVPALALIAAMPSIGGPTASTTVAFGPQSASDGGADAGGPDAGDVADAGEDAGADAGEGGSSGQPTTALLLGVSCGCQSSAASGAAFAALAIGAALGRRPRRRGGNV